MLDLDSLLFFHNFSLPLVAHELHEGTLDELEVLPVVVLDRPTDDGLLLVVELHSSLPDLEMVVSLLVVYPDEIVSDFLVGLGLKRGLL